MGTKIMIRIFLLTLMYLFVLSQGELRDEIEGQPEYTASAKKGVGIGPPPVQENAPEVLRLPLDKPEVAEQRFFGIIKDFLFPPRPSYTDPRVTNLEKLA